MHLFISTGRAPIYFLRTFLSLLRIFLSSFYLPADLSAAFTTCLCDVSIVNLVFLRHMYRVS